MRKNGYQNILFIECIILFIFMNNRFYEIILNLFYKKRIRLLLDYGVCYNYYRKSLIYGKMDKSQ